jgi:hypothetical protein
MLNTRGECFPLNYGIGECRDFDNLIDAECTEATAAKKPSYCETPWCFVDATTCNRENRFGTYFPAVAYSYDTCDYVNELEVVHPEIAEAGGAAEEHILNSTARAGTGPQVVADAFNEEVHAMETFVESGGGTADISEVADSEAHAVEVISEDPAADAHALTAVAHAESETIEIAALTEDSPQLVVEAVHEESKLIEESTPAEVDALAAEKEEEMEELMDAVNNTVHASEETAAVYTAAAAVNVSAASIVAGAKAEAEAVSVAMEKGAQDQMDLVAVGAQAEAQSHAAEADGFLLDEEVLMSEHDTPAGSSGCACLTNLSTHGAQEVCDFDGLPGVRSAQGACFSQDYGIGKCMAWDDLQDIVCLEAAGTGIAGEGSPPGHAHDAKPSYCERRFCYVDATKCDRDNRIGTMMPHAAYSYDTCDYANELAVAHPEMAEAGIAAEEHILESTARAGTDPQIVSDAFNEEVHAMDSFVQMGADSNELADVAETEAHMVAVVAEEGLGPHALTNAAHAESETIEMFALTGDSPHDVVDAVHHEADVIEGGKPPEIKALETESQFLRLEIENGVSDTGHASVETAHAISQAASFGAPAEAIVAGAEAEAAALTVAYETGVPPPDVGDSRLTILNSAVRAGESEKTVAETFQQQAHSVRTFAEMGGTSDDLAEVAEEEATAMESIASEEHTGPKVMTQAATAMADTLEVASMSGATPAEVIATERAESHALQLAQPFEIKALAADAHHQLDVTGRWYHHANVSFTDPPTAAPASAASGTDITALIMTLQPAQQAIIGSMSPTQQQQFVAASPSDQLVSVGFSLPPTPAPAPTPTAAPASAASGADITALIMTLQPAQQAIIGSMSPTQQQQFVAASPSAQLSSVGFSLPPTPAPAPTAPPTVAPSVLFSLHPTPAPTVAPSFISTSLLFSLPPTPVPAPTAAPTVAPSFASTPAVSPPLSTNVSIAWTSAPTVAPTVAPTAAPGPTAAPTPPPPTPPAPPAPTPPPASAASLVTKLSKPQQLIIGAMTASEQQAFVALPPTEQHSAVGFSMPPTPTPLVDTPAPSARTASPTFAPSAPRTRTPSAAPTDAVSVTRLSAQQAIISSMTVKQHQEFVASSPSDQLVSVGFSLPPTFSPPVDAEDQSATGSYAGSYASIEGLLKTTISTIDDGTVDDGTVDAAPITEDDTNDLTSLWLLMSLPPAEQEFISAMTPTELEEFMNSSPAAQVDSVGFSLPPTSAPASSSALEAISAHAEGGTSFATAMGVGGAATSGVVAVMFAIHFLFKRRRTSSATSTHMQELEQAETILALPSFASDTL